MGKYVKKGIQAEYTQETREHFFKALKNGKSIRSQATELKIPYSTLQRWVKNPNMVLGTGNSCVLMPSEEELLVVALEYCSLMGVPFTRHRLTRFVQSYCSAAKIKSRFKDGLPGKAWLAGFKRRQKDNITHRFRENLSKARAEGLSHGNVEKFFQAVYKPVYDEYGLKDKPWLLWNLDEAGFQADKAKSKVFVSRHLHNAYGLTSTSTKTTFTVLMCCNAIGQYLPPYTVFKGKVMQASWCQGGDDDFGYSISKSGWMFDVNFEAWFTNCFIPQTKERAGTHHQVLVYDGHGSHLTYKTVKAALDNNICIIALPPTLHMDFNLSM